MAESVCRQLSDLKKKTSWWGVLYSIVSFTYRFWGCAFEDVSRGVPPASQPNRRGNNSEIFLEDFILLNESMPARKTILPKSNHLGCYHPNPTGEPSNLWHWGKEYQTSALSSQSTWMGRGRSKCQIPNSTIQLQKLTKSLTPNVQDCILPLSPTLQPH